MPEYREPVSERTDDTIGEYLLLKQCNIHFFVIPLALDHSFATAFTRLTRRNK